MQAMGLVEAAQRLALLGKPCPAAQLRGLTAEGALHLVRDALTAFLKADPPLPESRSVQWAGMPLWWQDAGSTALLERRASLHALSAVTCAMQTGVPGACASKSALQQT